MASTSTWSDSKGRRCRTRLPPIRGSRFIASTRRSCACAAGLPDRPTRWPACSTRRRRGTRFVIDWHNLGYTLLRLRLGHWHPAVRLARWFERRDARRVEVNLCVSRGLAAFLESRFGVAGARVLYDRPAA